MRHERVLVALTRQAVLLGALLAAVGCGEGFVQTGGDSAPTGDGAVAADGPLAPDGVTADSGPGLDGPVVFANLTPPAWPNHIYVDVAATVTPPTYTLTPEIVYYDYYRNAEATPYRQANTVPTHTPRSSEGIVAGDSLHIVARAVYGGVEQPGVPSTAKVVEATPTTSLSAITQVATMQWTVGVPTAAVTPVSASGGTPPYAFAVAPALPAPLQLDAATGQIGSGTVGTASPATTYTVTVTDALDVTAQATFTASVTATGVEALPQIPYSAASPTVDGVSDDYDGVTPLLWDGNVMLGPVLDPNGSGRTVNLHRIMEAAPYGWGTTHRCELLYGETENRLPPGVDVWQAFAVMRKVGENLPEPTGDDSMLVFQSHSPESGDTYPPYSLVVSRQGTDQVRWFISYNTRPPSDWDWNGGAYPTVEDELVAHSEPLMPEGQWYRYILHYRAGYQSSHDPLTEVWRAKPGQAYEKLFSNTSFNAYNGGDGYPRIGSYKWDSNWNGQSSLAFYLTPLYYGRGTDLYAGAVAALEGL
jgi:hypothetical protein